MDETKIILDTNFFFVPFDFKIDIFQEFDRIIQKNYQLITFPAILKELVSLEQKMNSINWKKKIKLATNIADRCEICNESPNSNEKIDDFILRMAKTNNWIVATNDRELKKKLRLNHVRIVSVRQKSHLLLEGSLF